MSNDSDGSSVVGVQCTLSTVSEKLCAFKLILISFFCLLFQVLVSQFGFQETMQIRQHRPYQLHGQFILPMIYQRLSLPGTVLSLKKAKRKDFFLIVLNLRVIESS